MVSCGAIDVGVVVDTGVLACSRVQVQSYVTSLDVLRGRTKLYIVLMAGDPLHQVVVAYTPRA